MTENREARHMEPLPIMTEFERFYLRVLGEMLSKEVEDPYGTAYHEAGHALVAHYHRFIVGEATVVPRIFAAGPEGPSWGSVSTVPSWSDGPIPYSVGWFRARVHADVVMAGRAAIVEVFGTERAIELSAKGSFLGDYEFVDMLLEVFDYAPKTAGQRQAYIDAAEARASRIIRRNRSSLDHLAKTLKIGGTLDTETIQYCLDRVRRRRRRLSDGDWSYVNTDGWDRWQPISVASRSLQTSGNDAAGSRDM